MFVKNYAAVHEIKPVLILNKPIYEINKTSLSCFDDKRYVLDDGIYILSYFHKKIITN